MIYLCVFQQQRFAERCENRRTGPSEHPTQSRLRIVIYYNAVAYVRALENISVRIQYTQGRYPNPRAHNRPFRAGRLASVENIVAVNFDRCSFTFFFFRDNENEGRRHRDCIVQYERVEYKYIEHTIYIYMYMYMYR
jgi:hypothetical protein